MNTDVGILHLRRTLSRIALVFISVSHADGRRLPDYAASGMELVSGLFVALFTTNASFINFDHAAFCVIPKSRCSFMLGTPVRFVATK